MHRKRQYRHPRVAYAASVRLHSPDRRRTIDGRTINLSHSGVLVEALAPCAVGTQVICEIPLPGGATRLPGRVTRLQPLSPAAVGLAIEFSGVPAPDEQKLTEVVGQGDTGQSSRVVQVRFEGMREPLRSRATVTSDGIRLTTALPFLRLRSAVEVMFLSGRTKLSSHGVVRDIELDRDSTDGIPRLGVSVTLPTEQDGAAAAVTEAGGDQPGGAPAAAAAAAPAAETAEGAGAVAAARLAADLSGAPFGTPAPETRPFSTGMPALAPRAEREQRPRGATLAPAGRARGRVQRSLVVAALAVGLGMAGVVVTSLVRRPAGRPSPASSSVPRSTVAAVPSLEATATAGRGQPAGSDRAGGGGGPLPSGSAGPSGSAAAAAASGARGAGTGARASSPVAIPAVPAVPAVPALPNVPAASPASDPAAAPAATAVPQVAAIPPAAPTLVMPAPLPEETPGPELSSDGEETTAVVPVSGSTAGMTHHSLRNPRGLSVNLPHAESVLPIGVHAVNRDGLRLVWIRPLPGSGIQIRFLFTRPTPDERLLELEEDAVRIRVRLPRPPEAPETVAAELLEPPPLDQASELAKIEEN